jgi:hypothetical protein
MEKCKSTSETFKDCKTYEDVKRIIKEGVDPSTRDYSGKNEELYNRMGKNVLSKEQIEKESAERNFEEVFGKQPNKAGVLKKLKERSKEYKDANTYEDAMKILEKRRPAAHKRVSEHIDPDHPLQYADDATIDRELAERELSPADLEKAKNKEIEAKKEELFKPEATEKPKKASSRWSEEQENARQASV